MQKSNKRKYLIGALAVLLVAVVVGGTVAWLTASDKLENSFTVGEITDPVDPPADQPDPDTPGSNATLEGNLYEIYVDNSKIIPGDSISKQAWVGIGPKSEDSFVFAYIDNKMMSQTAGAEDAAYFTLNEGWKAVPDAADFYNSSTDNGKYTGGLFMWVGGESASDVPVALQGSDSADEWTDTPLFNDVVIPETAVASDFVDDPDMFVHSFIIAATDKVDGNKAIEEAKLWDTGSDGHPAHEEIAGEATTTPEP